jgi:membrane-associated phospholipid phosphatase
MLFILLWIMTFKNARRISPDIRPKIHVKILERRDMQIFGLSPIGLTLQCVIAFYGFLWVFTLSRRPRFALLGALPPFLLNLLYLGTHHLSAPLDVFAWLSYGVIHFVSPFLCAAWLWFFAPPGIVGAFAWSFGLQNCLGIITHLLFPTAPPWYGDQYGYPLPPGNYSMPGSSAGLVRVDKVLGTHLYENAFKASPLVFGAFPSLHGAFAACCFLFIGRYSLKGRYLLGFYLLWQWWATIYLRHHWRIDLLGGLAYAAFAFTIMQGFISRKEQDFEKGISGQPAWQRLWQGTPLEHFFEARTHSFDKLAMDEDRDSLEST